MKVCKDCKIEKEDAEFEQHYISRGKPAIRKSLLCHDCTKKWRKSYFDNSEVRKRQKEYRKDNPGKVKKWKRKHYKKHKEYINKKSKAWHENNKERAEIKHREYYDKHPEKKKEYSKRGRLELRDSYVTERLKVEFGFTYEEVKEDPELIELKRLQILLKRAAGGKGIRKNKENENDIFMVKEQQIQWVRSELNKLLNVNVIYGISAFAILDFKLRNDIFYIDVDDRDEGFEFTIDRAVDFIRELRVVKKSASSDMSAVSPTDKTNTAVTAVSADDNIAEKLKVTILDCIEKIKVDKSYIPQANAINAQIQTIINLKKLDIEGKKLKRSLEKSNQ